MLFTHSNYQGVNEMVIVMDMNADMNSGRQIEDEFGDFETEVLNAGWLPQSVLELGLREAVAIVAPRATTSLDAEAFLRTVYLSQE